MEKVERRIINAHPKDRLTDISFHALPDGSAPFPDGEVLVMTCEQQTFRMRLSDPKEHGLGTWIYQTMPA